MPRYSNRSATKLAGCHKDLQRVFNRVIAKYDCTIVCGQRGKEAQNQAYDSGFSNKGFPDSEHNTGPSKAIDVMVYFKDRPHLRWKDREVMYHFAGYVQRVADELGIQIRCGLDWDRDKDFHDQSFFDGGHFELVGKKYEEECKRMKK